MALMVRKRKDKAAQRQLERIQLAETPAQRVNAAFDYFRSGAKGMPDAAADQLRTQVAEYLIRITDQARKGAS